MPADKKELFHNRGTVALAEASASAAGNSAQVVHAGPCTRTSEVVVEGMDTSSHTMTHTGMVHTDPVESHRNIAEAEVGMDSSC